MSKPKRAKRGTDETAFNLRLPSDLVRRLDAVAEGGPVVISRNQLIHRVLEYFVMNFDHERELLKKSGTSHVFKPRDIRMHVAAGYLVVDQIEVRTGE